MPRPSSVSITPTRPDDEAASKSRSWHKRQSSSIIPLKFSFPRPKRKSIETITDSNKASNFFSRQRRNKSVSFVESINRPSVIIDSGKGLKPLQMSPVSDMDFSSSWLETSTPLVEHNSEDNYSEYSPSTHISRDTSHFSSLSVATELTQPSVPGSPNLKENLKEPEFPLSPELVDFDCPCSPKGDNCIVDCIYDDYFREEDEMRDSMPAVCETCTPMKAIDGLGLTIPAETSEFPVLESGSSTQSADASLDCVEDESEYDDIFSDYEYELPCLEASEYKFQKFDPAALKAIDSSRSNGSPVASRIALTQDSSFPLEQLIRNKPTRIRHYSKRSGFRNRAALKNSGSYIIRPPTPPKSPKSSVSCQTLQSTRKPSSHAGIHRRASQPPPVPSLSMKMAPISPKKSAESEQTPTQAFVVSHNTAVQNLLPFVLELLHGCIEELPLSAFYIDSEIVPLLRLLLSGGPSTTIDALVNHYARAYRFVSTLQRRVSSEFAGDGESLEQLQLKQLEKSDEVFEAMVESDSALRHLRIVFPSATGKQLSVLYALGLALKWIEPIANSELPVKTQATSPHRQMGEKDRRGPYYRDLRPKAILVQKGMEEFAKRWLGAVGIGEKCGDRGHVKLLVAIVGLAEENRPTWI